MHVFITCKYEKDRMKNSREKVETPFSPLQNLVLIGKVVSEKIRFEFLYVHDLGTRSVMTLTFNTHISSYIQLDVCSYQLSGHWLQ